MNIRTFTFISLLAYNDNTLFAQTADTTAADDYVTPQVEEYYEEDDIAVEAMPYEDYEAFDAVPEQVIRADRSINAFNYDNKIKVELSPDIKAKYMTGTNGMFSELFDRLSVPYMGNEKERYVVVRVTVGADSLLYNPTAIYTPGVTFTNHAQQAIQNLGLRFIPAMKNGKPVASYLYIPVRFDYILQSGRYK